MRNRLMVLQLLTLLLGGAATAHATSMCASVLTDDQLRELNAIVGALRPFSPHLGDAVQGDGAEGPVKRLTPAEIEKWRGAIAHPFVGAVRIIQAQDDRSDDHRR
jgi:hypothetical protein